LFLHGDETKIRALLDMIIGPDSPAAGKRYSSGKRSCETVLYKHGEFPQGMIGPALILWRVGKGARQLMIRVHPAVVEQVWDEVHICAKSVGEINIEDARFEIGAIDLFGPLATEVLSAVFRVGKGVSAKVWQHLRGLDDASSLPIGAVLDLKISDPRIEYDQFHLQH
jgi:ribonuclease P/MRP protein subunit POP1